MFPVVEGWVQSTKHHNRLDRVVAVKTIQPRLTQTGFEEELRARFEAEARVCLPRHPGIVTVYDYGEYNDVLFAVLEHIAGETQGIDSSAKTLTYDEAVHILQSLTKR